MKYLRWSNGKNMMVSFSDIFLWDCKIFDPDDSYPVYLFWGIKIKRYIVVFYELSSMIHKCFVLLFPLSSSVENKTSNLSLT